LDVTRLRPVLPARRFAATLAPVLVLFLLAACGSAGVEGVGAPKQQRTTQAPPPPPSAQQSRRQSAAGFVGADAVIVGRGDSVYALSRRHGVSARAIIEANNLRPPYHLRIGQRIVLPRAKVHVVRRGESLYGISKRYGVSTYSIARTNSLRPPYALSSGQQLRIPAAGSNLAAGPRGGSRAVSAALEPKAANKRIAAKQPKRAKSLPKPAPRRGFIWPLQGRVISGFGSKAKGLQNDGINISAPRGTPVRVAENGVVAYAGNELRGFGNLLLVKHSDGWVTAYAHNDVLLVKRGQKVRRGQVISKVGSTGAVSRPQLHFELRKRNKAVDPTRWLRRGAV